MSTPSLLRQLTNQKFERGDEFNLWVFKAWMPMQASMDGRPAPHKLLLPLLKALLSKLYFRAKVKKAAKAAFSFLNIKATRLLYLHSQFA